MTPPLAPEENIGPYYKAIGVACIGALVWLLRVKTGETTWQDVAVYGILGLLALSSLRPRSFDGLVRRVATALPFTKYGGDTPAGEGGGKAE